MVMSSRLKVNFDQNKVQKELKKGINEGLDEAGKELIDKIDEYVPFKDGGLSESVSIAYDKQIGFNKNKNSIQMNYETPYAEKQFFNKTANFNKKNHPKAQAEWTEPIMGDDNLIEDVTAKHIRKEMK